MPTVETLLSRGYLPRELPPPFESLTFGNLMSGRFVYPPDFDDFGNPLSKISKLLKHSYVKVGTLRRQLSIPNPVHYYRLSKTIVDNWTSIVAILDNSHFSLTRPIDSANRAVEPRVPFADRILAQAELRVNSTYLLKTDITRFYPSIYTHSIPWAIHTKTFAKVNRGRAHWGNVVDELSRNMQDGQTIGLPIGPDTSLIIAELILTQIDVSLHNKGVRKAIRYIDDYEFGFQNLQEAENTLLGIQQSIGEYELELNHTKTSIQKLPRPIEVSWVSKLRGFNFNNRSTSEKFKLLEYINLTFELSHQFPEDGVIKYAIARLQGEVFTVSNWSFLENLLLQCVSAEPGSINYVLIYLKTYHSLGYPLDLPKIEMCFNSVIKKHLLLGHSSEVAWAIWSIIELELNLTNDIALLLTKSEDPIIILLFLDANQRGRVNGVFPLSNFQILVDANGLYSEYWLLIYEAVIKGWLVDTNCVTTSDPLFSFMRANNIFFYNSANALTFGSPVIFSGRGGGGVGGPYAI